MPNEDHGLSPNEGRLARLGTLLTLRARSWSLLLPLHLIAFLALYAVSYRHLQSEIVNATTAAARQMMAHEIDELMITVPSKVDGQPGHLFDSLISVHESLQYRLFDKEGNLISGASTDPTHDQIEVQRFLEQDFAERSWLDSEDGRSLKLLERIVARPDCGGCHDPGELLGVATATVDLTSRLTGAHGRVLRNMMLLLGAWVVAFVAMAVVVGRSVKRSVSRLEQDLEAVEAGQTVPPPMPEDLALDPGSAALHDSLRRFLRRTRDRHAEVASRLQHTDQLASVGRLAAGLAHEIKNPLAGIQSALEIMNEDTGEDSTRKLSHEMLRELDRVNQTLKLLLESGRPSPPLLTETDLSAVLEETERLLEPGLRRRGVSLEVDATSAPFRAKLDRGKIRQVLVNLVTNAAEAMKNGGRVTIRAARVPENGGVVLAVEDTGPGIPPDELDRVFEPFFTTKFDGTGLGLAIARRLVVQHGGSIEVESTPGRGSTFLILLPDAAVPDGDAPTSG